MTPFKLHLKAGERFYINGAVLRADRKVSLDLLNDAVFLMEHHVMTPEQTCTPLRQLYFVIQSMMIEPGNCGSARMMFETSHALLMTSFKNTQVVEALQSIREATLTGRYFDALKRLRPLFVIEDAILAGGRNAVPPRETSKGEAAAWT